MGSVLRIYDPAECDAAGVPLDWDCCRECAPSIDVPQPGTYVNELKPGWRDPDCRPCGGHGSLKAAVRAALLACCTCGSALACPPNCPGRVRSPEPRCEDCGHLMSDGTWEQNDRVTTVPMRAAYPSAALAQATRLAACGRAEFQNYVSKIVAADHYSPCDEGCTHDGPGRAWMPEGYDLRAPAWEYHDDADAVARQDVRDNGLGEMQASWRPVDVRTLGWPHDLRPTRLVILCLSCWADRNG